MAFSIYAVPALLGFLTKIGIFLYARRFSVRSAQTSLFLLFLASFAFLNAVEFTFFMKGEDYGLHMPGYHGRLWFACASASVAFLLHFSLVTAIGPRPPNQAGLAAWCPLLIYAPALALQILLWSGPHLIVDFEPMAYTFTKIPGPLYFLWEIYVVGYCVAALGLLAHGALRQPGRRPRLQNRLLLAGLVPLVALALLIIGLQRLGFRGFNATATLPFTSTFLLFVAAYALYHYRLLDVGFYVPWSKSRREKTELYARLERMAAEIRESKSPWDILERLAEGLRCRVALLGGPQPWSAAPGALDSRTEDLLLAEFPSEALNRVDRAVTVEEVAHTDPELHELMKRYKVGAIVPFRSHRTIPGFCLVLGQRFNEAIYSSLDFKVADRLFSAMAQRFFEDFLLVRSQLHHVREQLQGTTRNLMRTEQSLTGVRHKLRAAKEQNRSLREELARLRRAGLKLVKPEPASDPTETLDEHLAGREKAALLSALEHTAGEREAAARLLGIPLRTLERLIAHYRIDPNAFRDP